MNAEPMTNAEKLAAAKAWMRERGIKTREWKGPANPLPNLAHVQPIIACYDVGIIGQFRQLLRTLTQ